MRLIDLNLLSAAERTWIDAYHTRVAQEIGPILEDPSVVAWLDRATQPL